MAPPSPRRPGFSRRAQYGIFASYVIAVAGAAVALLLVITARFDPEGHSALQTLATDLTHPISSAGRSLALGLEDGAENIAAYMHVGSKNRALEKELAAARIKLVQAETLRVENARLKKILGIQDKTIKPVADARIVSSTGTSSRRYATLTAGADSGVANGQPVLGPDGLIGRIVATGRSSARVLLIVDAGNVTPVKRTTDGAPALAIGNGDGSLTLRPLSAETPPFRTRDMFVTSGSGGIYRPGIPVARAIKARREGTLARPAVDLTRLDFARVEPAFQAKAPAAPSAITSQEDQ